jgi:methionyl-tRNA formyltransferase
MNGKPAPIRSVFFGTPEIAVAALNALHEVSEVVGVVTQPDRPSGRGLELTPPAVKRRALELGINVTQPVKVRTGELRSWLEARAADVFVVLAYGRILPPDILAVPPRGALNLHASLLPKYRGAAPIQWCIVRGETETGISLMQMDEGLDTGAVLSRHVIPIGEEETAGELAERLSTLAADVVKSDLPRVMRGELTAEPQDHARATHAPPLERENGRVSFDQPAREIANLVRGLWPKPGAFTSVGEKTLRLVKVRASDAPLAVPAGSVVIQGGTPWVATAVGSLEILQAKLEGKRESSGRDLVNGRVLAAGLRLGAAPAAK